MTKGRVDRVFGKRSGNIQQLAIDQAVERDYGEVGYERTSSPPSQPIIMASGTQIQGRDQAPELQDR